MNKNKFFFTPGKAVFMLGSLLTLTGCVGYVDGPRAGLYVEPPAVEVGVQDNYVYYPGYDIYYNSHLGLYGYMDGGVWVSRPEPRGVSVDVLLASPSVKMDFHDSPANHYAEVSRQYPRNWVASDARPDQKARVERAPVKKAQARKTNQKPEKRDEHEGK